MAKLAVLISGLLLVAESQASDVAQADPSTVQGFLSKYMTASTQRIATSNVKHGNGPDALSHHNSLAEHGLAADEVSSPSMIEKTAAQKLLANGNSTPITLSAIGVGMLALVTMLGVRMQRGLRPATVLAGSGTLGSGMSNSMAPGLNGNIAEMKSQDSTISSVAFGEGISELKHGRIAMLAAKEVPVNFHSSRSGASLMFEADRVLGMWDPLNFLPSDPNTGWQPMASSFGIGAAPAAPQPAVFFVAASSSASMSSSDRGRVVVFGSVARCEEKIMAALEPASLTVTNSEEDPNGTHIAIVIVSDKFEGLSRVKRQQLVMRSIKDEMDSGAIHAIDSLKTQTPAEAAA